MAQQSRGECQFCGYTATKSGITKHLANCPQRQVKIAAVTQKGGGCVDPISPQGTVC